MIEFLELYQATVLSCKIRSLENRKPDRQFDDLTLVRRSAWCPVPLDRPSNRDECLLAFDTPDNTGNEQRGILGSALLEEKYVLLCLSARAITEAA